MAYEKNKGMCMLMWIILLGTIGVAIAGLVIALENEKKLKGGKESFEGSESHSCPIGLNNEVCSGPEHGGVCKPNNTCDCDSIPFKGWQGPTCSIPRCSVGPNGKVCSGSDQGQCHPLRAGEGDNSLSGFCSCSGDWTGGDCSCKIGDQKCLNKLADCGRCTFPPYETGCMCQNGVCDFKTGKCVCWPDSKGEDCDIKMDCEPPCSVFGKCGSSGWCICDPGWKGMQCTEKV